MTSLPPPFETRDAQIIHIPDFLSEKAADHFYSALMEETDWQQFDVKVFGKIYPQPRLCELYADTPRTYTYSGLTLQTKVFTPTVDEIRKKIALRTGRTYNSVLLNLYRDGRDSNGWHADNEKELGPEPSIASISLGATRHFMLKHRQKKEWKHKIALEHGSLLLMEGPTQSHWLHQIPKTATKVNPRINLTFRNILV